MEQFTGKSIFKGTAIGRVLFYSKNQQQVKRAKVEDPEAEIARYEEAKAKAIEQLGALHDKALAEVGEANAMIFEVHAMMLEDDDYNESVENIIR
ncbi:MAG: phosphoenolpyruvate--protein phosphotransferase, partial [Clostridiales bacterium]|nr:phosphoenolpyruvate--protein phosphotransferase [Clostridiales bacterium]